MAESEARGLDDSPAPLRRRVWHPALWPLLALAVLLVFNALFTPGFFHIEVRDGRLFGSLVDVLNRGTPVMLTSLGMTLVIATAGIDLSVGAVMAIAGTVAAALVARPDYSPLSGIDLHGSAGAAIATALAVSLLAGAWNGFLVAWLDVQPIVATLILMVAGRGLAQLFSDGQIVTFENPALAFVGGGFFLGLPFPLTLVAGVLGFTALLTRGTALGLFIESVGNNPAASRLAGVNTRMARMLVYVFCALCAGLSGIVVMSDIKAADANNAGLYLELDAILASVIGGTSLAGGRFSLAGTLAGAILIQTLTTTILTRGVDPAVTLILKAGVVVAVCLLQAPAFRSLWQHRGGVTS